MNRYSLDYINGYAIVINNKTKLICYASKNVSEAITACNKMEKNEK